MRRDDEFTSAGAANQASGQAVSDEESHPEVSAAHVIRAFIGYYAPHKFLFVFDLVCATVLAVIDLAFPQFLNFFTKDFFLQPASVILRSLVWILLLFAVLYLIRTGCQYFITYWGHVMGARMEATMRHDLFAQYQNLSFDYYDRHNTGAMMSKIANDLFDISELAHHGPENLFICVLKIAGSFILLFLINVPLTAIMLAATIIMAAYSFWRNYRRRVIFREKRARMASINATVQDSLGGIRVVKSFGGEHAEDVKFGRANEAFLDTKERSYRFMGSFHAASSLFTGVLYTVTVVGGGYFIAKGSLQVTDLAIFALYIGIFISPIDQLVNFTETLQKGYAGFRRFMEVLAEVPAVADAPDARPIAELEKLARTTGEGAGSNGEGGGSNGEDVGSSGEGADPPEGNARPPEEGAGSSEEDARSPEEDARSSGEDAGLSEVRGDVRYRDVHFNYDEGVPVLKGLDLHIPAGETVALVGPSGGGKTTTCSLLPRFYDPDEGSIEIDGIDIRDVTVESLRNAIGIVQQDVYLFGGTVRENIAYGRPDATDEEIVEAAKRASIHDFICTLPEGYETVVGERGARLSGGQKQRVAIARVFLRDPQILILDEATSALDNESERAVQKSLEDLAHGRTTIVIAHRLSTIRQASTIAVVEDGRVVEMGCHDELIAQGGTYARYYRMQFGDGAES